MGSKRKRGAKDAEVPAQLPAKRSKSEPEPASTPPTREPLAENPFFDDRVQEAKLYDQLGSEDEAERLKAASTLITNLLGGDVVSESILARHLEKRLFRGLASGRKASRLGFSVVLTEILEQLFGEKDLAATKYTGLTFERVLGFLMEKTHAAGSVPGQEKRDHYFGQLFGIECFVRANILFGDKTRWGAVLDLLIKLAKKMVWLRSQCGWVIIQAVPQMKQKVAETTLQKIQDEGLAKTPEGIGIWIVALDRFPDMKLPAKPWKHPLASKSLQELPSVLKDSGREPESGEKSGNQKQKQGNWTAQLHFVWDIILAHYLKLAKQSEGEADENFKLFWNRTVDEGFFSKGSPDTQKFSGFVIFQKMLQGLADYPFLVQRLFSKNLTTSLMNQAAKEDRYLHRAAVKTLRAIESIVETHPILLDPVLNQLLGGHGDFNFDKRTNSKTIERLLQNTTAESINEVLQTLEELANIEADSQAVQSLGAYLVKLTSASPAAVDDAEDDSASIAGPAIEQLVKLAYRKEDADNDSATAKWKTDLRGRLTTAFAKLLKRPEGFLHLCNAVLAIDTSLEMSEELEEVLSEALGRLRELLASTTLEDLNPAFQGLALLHGVGILQLYNEDPDALDVLSELKACFTKLNDLKESERDESGVSEFLVETLLSMVARPSSLMRQVSQQAFEDFTHLMSAEAIKLLTDTLVAEENSKGLQALFSTDEDMEDAEDADMDGSSTHPSHSDEDLDSDVELVDLDDADITNGIDGHDSEASSSDEDEEDDDDDEDDDEKDSSEEAGWQDPEALDNALAQVLGSHRLDKDEDADSSDEDADMTDSEMEKLDDKLVAVFRQRTKGARKKKDNKDAKETVINFKHRVLDLLAIYVKKEASTRTALEVLIPLLQLMRTTTVKALSNKASEIISSFSKSRKKVKTTVGEPSDLGDNASDLLDLLRAIHAEAPQDPSHAFARAASTASLTVASHLYGDEETRRLVLAVYNETWDDWWCKRKIRLQPAFFNDWTVWCHNQVESARAEVGV